MRVITTNLNGIRSAAKKGFFDWFIAQDADFLCVQEIKAQEIDLSPELLKIKNYSGYFHCAEKKGYSGTGIYTRYAPDEVIKGWGNVEFDAEGRYIELRFSQLSIISAYLPSGSSSEIRQQAKYRFMAGFMPYLMQLKQKNQRIILCGDLNIAHQERDIKNWKGNLKNSGFLPEERIWLTQLLNSGYQDVFRLLDQRENQYTWWSARGKAYLNNVGWRIDYQLATPLLAQKAYACCIYKQHKFSDHAPLTVDYHE